MPREVACGKTIYEDKKQGLKVYRHKNSFIVQDRHLGMRLNKDFSRGELFLTKRSPLVFKDYPLQHPFDKIIILDFLHKGQGALLHACGISYKAEGLLFLGKSGAGKSTLANLWRQSLSIRKGQDTLILNDDRIILKKIKNDFFIYGTPWAGDALACAANSARLKRVFFLTHSRTSYLTPLQPQDTIARLFGCTLNYLWQKNTLKKTLGLYLSLIKKVPCFEFGFPPNKEALNFISRENKKI